MLLLRLLEEKDMYGYEMIDTLRQKSCNVFELKAGTLYPLLHSLEEKGYITSYQDDTDAARPRKYYHLTTSGRKQLHEKQEEWRRYSHAVDLVMEGGVCFA